MKLPFAASDNASLIGLGEEACRLLGQRQFEQCADRFGYAIASGRNVTSAIAQDLALALIEPASALALPCLGAPAIRVLRYQPNDLNLVAVIECLCPTLAGARVLVELVVTKSGAEEHVTLEQISGAA